MLGGDTLRLSDRAEKNVGAGNWKGLGMWVWILFRVSGLVVAAYLVAHIAIISQARMKGPASLDGTLGVFDHPLFVLLDLLLVWAVLFHSFNGIRVVMMDLGVGIRRHKAVFLTLMLLAIVSLSLFALKAFQFIGRG
jgi:succinate dehydrogenase / fumarate reductase cytochrome b subunit